MNFIHDKTCQSHETPEKGTSLYGIAAGTLSSGHDMAVAILNQIICGDPQESLTRLRSLMFPHTKKPLLSVPPLASGNHASVGVGAWVGGGGLLCKGHGMLALCGSLRVKLL